MKDLFLSEWRRFRRLTLIVTVCHALLLLFLSRVTNLMQLGYEDHAAMLVAYLLLGVTLAVVQVGSYRKPSQWLWLVHRPLSPQRIFHAFALSALATLATVVLLPLFLFVLLTDVFTNQVVDSRHYVALLHAIAFTMMAWLAGAHACVSRHKAAIAVLLAPLLLALHLASVWTLLLPVFACVGWMAFVAQHSFRADREAPILHHSVLLLTALPLQLVFFLLLFHVSKATLEIVELTRAHQRAKIVLSTESEAAAFMRTFGQEFVIKGLAASSDPRAASWREQLPLLDVADVIPDIDRFPVRHQISNLGAIWWDEKRNIEWSFSHDRMRYHGRDPRTGAERGWWGANGVASAQAFVQPPMFGMTQDTFYAIDDQTQRQHELVHLPVAENFIGRPSRALDRLFVLTTKRLVAYRPDRGADSLFAPPLLDWQLPLPASKVHVAQINVAELMDGWLISFFHDPGHDFDGFEQWSDPWQQVVFVDEAGKATVVGERHGIRDHHAAFGGPPLVPVTSWWLSPVLYAFAKSPDLLLDKGLARPDRFDLMPDVPQLYPLAAGLALLSLVLGNWWMRRAQVSRTRRYLWLASCAALGLPALLALTCLERRLPQH